MKKEMHYFVNEFVDGILKDKLLKEMAHYIEVEVRAFNKLNQVILSVQSPAIELTNDNIEGDKVKSSLVEINHVTDDGVIREIILNLDNIKITFISEISKGYPACSAIHWYIPGNNEHSVTHTTHSLKELKQKLFGDE